MRTTDFDYDLPPERIAQVGLEPRDASRLLRLGRADGAIAHHRFAELPDLLRPGDLLVANDSKVIAARLLGAKAGTGGKVEALLLRPSDEADGAERTLVWRCLLGGRVREGTWLRFGSEPESALEAEVQGLLGDGQAEVRFDRPPLPELDRLGLLPLPPYIHAPLADPGRYQTLHAHALGSAAAPTAGLHFTPVLRERLAERGIGWATVTLHVGLDTFRPMEVEDPHDHRMHSEWVRLDEATARSIRECRAAGGRVIAVGTTSLRCLETAARATLGAGGSVDELGPYEGWTDLFIKPGDAFHLVDGLVTNFHQPRSTLLVLVSAFAGRERVLEAYRVALEEGYRFLSLGDAMLVV